MNKKELIKKINNKQPLFLHNSNYRTLIVSRERELSVILSSFLASAISIKTKVGAYVLSLKKKDSTLDLTYHEYINKSGVDP